MAAMRSGSSWIRYSRMSPPMTLTWLTPPMARRRGRTTFSAMVRSSVSDVLSAVRPTMSISPRIDERGPSTGVATPAGRASATVPRRSVTIWRAWYTSVSQSNSTHTTEKPVDDVERTRRTPEAPLTAVSMG